MKLVRYRYRVEMHSTMHVWARTPDEAIGLSTLAVMGPRWQHRRPWIWLPWWSRRIVQMCGANAEPERIGGVR